MLTRVHLIKGYRDWQLFLDHSLNVLEHLQSFSLLLKLTLDLAISGFDIVRHTLHDGAGISRDRFERLIFVSILLFSLCFVDLLFLFSVGVGGPEASQELTFSDVALLGGSKPIQEHFDMLVRQAKLESDQSLSKLIKGHSLRVVCVDKIEAFADGRVLEHQVVANSLE